jgi:ribose/xylose/arabinose/galactoside ABC-type transport system permease subunit
VAAIAVLNNGLVHARQPREVAGLLTGALLIFALCLSAIPKSLATLRARRHTARTNIQTLHEPSVD